MVTIHREGRSILVTILLILLAIDLLISFFFKPEYYWTGVMILVSVLLFSGCALFFRNPIRQFVVDPNAVIAPADGKIVVIEEVYESEYFKDTRLQVSIFMSLFNVHVNRWPIGGKITYFKHHSGRYHAAFLPKASTENERATTVIKNNEGKEILVRQIAGAVARRIITYACDTECSQQSGDLGFIRFGSRVDLLLPRDTELNVKIGDAVQGGITSIANI